MSNVKSFFKGLCSEQKGQTLTEYALILVLVAVVAIAVLTTLGDNIIAVFESIIAAL